MSKWYVEFYPGGVLLRITASCNKNTSLRFQKMCCKKRLSDLSWIYKNN